MIKTGIVGACGRMGRRNAIAVHHSKTLSLTGLIEKEGHADIGRTYGEIVGDNSISLILNSDISNLCHQADVLVDFTHPEVTMNLLEKAIKNQTNLVIGTTGFSTKQIELIKLSSKEIGIVLSGNFSTGINLLLGLVKKSAQILGSEYNIEIVEQHHNQKIDAPSGTAIMLAKAAASGRGLDYDKTIVTERKGQVGRRTSDEIGVFALRGGGIVGHHSIYFMGENDKVELTHMAQDRNAFSNGVVTACRWVARQKPGFYDMSNVLGLK